MINVRQATEHDAPAIVALLEGLDAFYGEAPVSTRDVREQQVRELLFGAVPVATVLLALEGADVAGIASFSILWPAAGVTHSLYVKELYVDDSFRRRGVGRQLMVRICAIAEQTGCSRVEWTTDQSNPTAQAFYQSLDVPVNPTKLNYRIDGNSLARLARAHLTSRTA